MAFSERMVLKKATTMSLHERFSQMRHEKITQPPEPKYSAPPVRSAPPPLPPPLPPRISDYYDDDSDDVQIISSRNSSAQYHGLFDDKFGFRRRPGHHQTAHSLAFQTAMQIKKKTFQNFNRIPVKQRLGLNRTQNFKPWYRRNWSARGGRARNFRGRNWGGGNWSGGRSRSRSQSFSNIDRPLTNNFRRSRSLPRWSRNGRGGFRGNRRGRGGFKQNQISKETLDAELDTYMADTKTVLDQELDDYMAQGVAHKL